ncbi:3-hydroxybutyrate dehydrogenase [Mobilicoccus massiliensis]|uniref:3-hydroxybutyrate dehydrogenase n=1 Tax=Mobilicoccus massiliensis TaxID=1522310 RepID=UPI00059035A4|nr:3-hydroxybutyrate dehydrogenase [Mobilicoccus massiliensis]
MSDLVNVDLSGRTAIITGGVSGIGLACTQALAGAGAEVVVIDLDEEAASSVAEPLGGRGIGADLSDSAVLDRLDVTADIIVNNAGFQRVSPVHEFEPDVFRAIQRVMLEAPFMLIRASLPRMYEQEWGRIVNISSVHGLRASAFKSAYVSAKHGLEGLSKVVALEGAEHGVTSNCINPGYVRTPLVQKQIADQARVHGMAEDEVVAKVMLHRMARKVMVEPDEVADLALFLCSPAAVTMTGGSYVLDGGWTAS